MANTPPILPASLTPATYPPLPRSCSFKLYRWPNDSYQLSSLPTSPDNVMVLPDLPMSRYLLWSVGVAMFRPPPVSPDQESNDRKGSVIFHWPQFTPQVDLLAHLVQAHASSRFLTRAYMFLSHWRTQLPTYLPSTRLPLTHIHFSIQHFPTNPHSS